MSEWNESVKGASVEVVSNKVGRLGWHEIVIGLGMNN
jgi:hypothetical protein